MSDKMRWRYGDTNPCEIAVDADEVIEIGDLVWLLDDSFPTSRLVNAPFLGVSMQRSRKGDTAPIRFSTSGVFEFPCQSMSALPVGTRVKATGRQYIGLEGTDSWEVGIVQRVPLEASTEGPSVFVDIHSRVLPR